jgi:uncharacterized membrane protein
MNYAYTAVQWLFFFYLYCFFGWCFESAYVSLKSHKPVNRGFMRGPFLPLYGSGATMMLVVSAPVQNSLVLTYLAGCVGATALEYVTGVTMEALFKVRYWDYSDKPFNYKGHICLGSTLTWGFFTIMMTHVVHKPIEAWVLSIPEKILTPITLVLSVGIVVDFTLSFKAAMDLRDILIRMEEAKGEMERLQKRLDVVIALAEQSREQKLQGVGEKLNGLKDRLSLEELIAYTEGRFAQVRGRLAEGEYSAEITEEMQVLREKFRYHRESRFQMSHGNNSSFRALIKGNPTMRSEKFREALEELKEAVEERKEKKEEQGELM